MGFDLNLICIGFFFFSLFGFVVLASFFYCCLGFFFIFFFAWLDESQWGPESQNGIS